MVKNDKIGHPKGLTLVQLEFIAALEQHLGIVSTASKQTGTARQTHYNWMSESEEYAKAVHELKHVAHDFGESCLFQSMKEGNAASIIFYAKTQMKDRGYVESQEIRLEHHGLSADPDAIAKAIAEAMINDDKGDA